MIGIARELCIRQLEARKKQATSLDSLSGSKDMHIGILSDALA